MMPYNLSFRSLLKKYIPTLPIEKIDEHESLFSHRTQLKIEHTYKMVPFPFLENPKEYLDKIKMKIDTNTQKAEAILLPYKNSYNAAYQLWIAHREVALEQGNFLQIPTSLEGLTRFIGKVIKYQFVKIKTLPILWAYKIKYLWQILFKRKYKRDTTPEPPIDERNNEQRNSQKQK